MWKLGYDSNDNDDSEIERCPFCGGEAIADVWNPMFRHSLFFAVRCTDCGAMTWPYHESVANAISAWNRSKKK